MISGDSTVNHRRDDLRHLMGQHTAIGITQHDPARASIIGGMNGLQRVIGVRLIAVKEVFGIKQPFTPLPLDMGKAGGHVFDVILKADAKGGRHMEIMRLAHQTDRRRGRIHHSRQHVVILGRAPVAFGHAKSGEGGFGLRRIGEKIRIGRVCSGPSAFDIVDPQTVQDSGDLVLFSS